jgi:hypothetical protein
MAKVLEHPLETTFGLSAGSTLTIEENGDNMLMSQPEPAIGNHEDDEENGDNMLMSQPEPAIGNHEDDEEDKDINDKIETIYTAAIDAFETQLNSAEFIEARYAARNAEVAAQYLNTALNAVSLKARTKNDKRKNQQFIPFGNNITNSNVIVSDRNSVLQLMREAKERNEI